VDNQQTRIASSGNRVSSDAICKHAYSCIGTSNWISFAPMNVERDMAPMIPIAGTLLICGGRYVRTNCTYVRAMQIKLVI